MKSDTTKDIATCVKKLIHFKYEFLKSLNLCIRLNIHS